MYYKVIVQKKNRLDKYYPALISASATDAYQAIPTADIKIVTNSRAGTRGYVSPIATDDHIRLQVAITYNPTQKKVWTDIFQGTVQEIESVYGASNVSNLHCVGYLDEARWTMVDNALDITTLYDAVDIFSWVLNTQAYKRYLTFSDVYLTRGITFSTYNTSVNQAFFADILSDMEEYSGFRYRASAVPIYDAKHNLSTVYLSWKPLSTVVTDKYKIIEGTSRYISSEFSVTIEDLITYIKIIGESTVNGIWSQDADAAAITRYGKRSRIDTRNWITNSDQCFKAAHACLEEGKIPIIAGTATIIGTPYAKVGDLVYCKSPSQEIERVPVDTNMTVYRVTHNITETGYTTSLDLGKIKKTAYDYIGYIAKTTKVNKKNICRR